MLLLINHLIFHPRPSFSLLDEDLGEGIAFSLTLMQNFFLVIFFIFLLSTYHHYLCVTAGKTAAGVEDDDCRVITEKKVFQHIREKARNFPISTASNNAQSASSEPLILTRKHFYEQRLQLHDELDVPEETEGSIFPQATLLNLSSGSTEAELKEHGFNSSLTAAGNLGTINLLDDTGAFSLPKVSN